VVQGGSGWPRVALRRCRSSIPETGNQKPSGVGANTLDASADAAACPDTSFALNLMDMKYIKNVYILPDTRDFLYKHRTCKKGTSLKVTKNGERKFIQ